MDKVENKEKNKKNKLIITTVLAGILIVLIVGISYAYFKATASGATQKVTTDNMQITYTNEVSTFNNTKLIPITDEEVTSEAAKVSFTLKNTGSNDVYADIRLENIVLPEILEDSDFMWDLYESSTRIATGNFSNLQGSTKVDLIEDNLKKGASKYYTLYVYVAETGKNQNYLRNNTFNGKVVAEATSKSKYKALTPKVPTGYTGIYTASDLKNIKNNLSGKYILMNNITLKSSDYNNPTIGWEPIGTYNAPFTGTFDGNGFQIRNLYFHYDFNDSNDSPSGDYSTINLETSFFWIY